MGTRMAPSYANIFMKYVENQLIDTSPKKPKLWLRFIDDIFMIWGYGKQALEDFKHLAYIIHPTIKFSFNSNEQEIPFLDTIIYRGNNNHILTRLYHKPTDNKQYLHFKLSSPMEIEKSVPYGLLIRCRRICSEETYLNRESRIINTTTHFQKIPNKPTTRGIGEGKEHGQITAIRTKQQETIR